MIFNPPIFRTLQAFCKQAFVRLLLALRDHKWCGIDQRELTSFNDDAGQNTDVIFPTLANSSSLRSTFVSSAISYATSHGFDGIDLDYEVIGLPCWGLFTRHYIERNRPR